MEPVFVARYFSSDRSRSYDVIIELHNLGQSGKYGFVSSLSSLVDYHGQIDCEICLLSKLLNLWPYCEVFLRFDSRDILILKGRSYFDQETPGGYCFW